MSLRAPIIRMLTPPALPDREERRIGRLVHLNLYGFAVLLVLKDLARWLLVGERPQPPNIAMVSVTVISLVIARRRPRVGGAFFCIALFGLISFATYQYAALDGIALLRYALLILAAGFFLGGRAALSFAAASSVTAFVMIQLPGYGRLWTAPKDFDSLDHWVILTFALVMVSVVVYGALESLYGALAEARNNEAQLASLVSSSPAGIITLDADSRVMSANPAAVRILGRSEAALIGAVAPTGWGLTSDAQARVAAHLDSVRAGDDPGALEVMLVGAEGIRVDLEMRAACIHRDDGTYLLQLVLRDDTERKQADAARLELAARLQEAQRLEAMGRLAGGVAHDINNLLTIVLANTTLLQRRITDVSTSERLTEVADAAERAAHITNQLLAFGRAQFLHPELVELKGAVQAIEPLLRRMVGPLIRLDLRPGPELALARVDRTQLDQILVNLVTNARDAMPAGGRLVVETGQLSLDAPLPARGADIPAGDYVFVAVEDSGQGMEEPVLQRIFEPFFTTKHAGRGTGLGLATVLGIARQSEGYVDVQSRPGHGSRFTVYLPMASQVQTAAEITADRATRCNVVIAEDEEQLRTVMRIVLEEAGYTILAADLPETLVEQFTESETRIDLLVTDMVMPGMNGAELANRLHAAHPGMRTVIASGYTPQPVEEQPDRTVFLQKPFTPERLLEKVREAMS